MYYYSIGITLTKGICRVKDMLYQCEMVLRIFIGILEPICYALNFSSHFVSFENLTYNYLKNKGPYCSKFQKLWTKNIKLKLLTDPNLFFTIKYCNI